MAFSQIVTAFYFRTMYNVRKPRLPRYFKVKISDSNSDFDDYVADKICRRQVYDVGDGFDSCLFAYVYQYLLKR